MSEAKTEKTYEGGCHCGKVRYKVTTALAQVIECNCSICSKRGHMLSFVDPDKFESISGEDSLTDYQFNKKVIHHRFCKVCGINSWANGTRPDGKPMVAINVRCLDGVDPWKIEATKFDGKSR